MSSFLQRFAQEVQRIAPDVRAALSPEAQTEEERRLKRALIENWHPLPPFERSNQQPVYAVDGSSAIRRLNNGWTVLMVQALAIGPEFEIPEADVRFVRSTVGEATLSRYASLLMRHLELKVALEATVKAQGGVLCLDGSFQTDIPHCLYALEVEGERDLPLGLLQTYMRLVEACQARGITLIALSKTSTASFLTEAITLNLGEQPLPGDAEIEADEEALRLSDAEVIFRWTEEPGLSTPLVLGAYGLGHRRLQFVRQPEALVSQFGDNRRYLSGHPLGLFQRLQRSPATVSFHLRLSSMEEPLRVDVPASMLGLPYNIADVYLAWAKRGDVLPALGPLVTSYGGPNVYNAAIYVADRLVRLTNPMVDGPYLSIIRQHLGQYLQYDRSQRRFL